LSKYYWCISKHKLLYRNKYFHFTQQKILMEKCRFIAILLVEIARLTRA
jgi:hypothetical protein